MKLAAIFLYSIRLGILTVDCRLRSRCNSCTRTLPPYSRTSARRPQAPPRTRLRHYMTRRQGLVGNQGYTRSGTWRGVVSRGGGGVVSRGGGGVSRGGGLGGGMVSRGGWLVEGGG